MPVLFIYEPEKTVKKLRIFGKVATAGRDLSCDIVLNDPTLKPVHMRFMEEGKFFTVAPLDKNAEIYIKGKKIKKEILREGDLLYTGNSAIRFHYGDVSFEEEMDRVALRHLKSLYDFNIKLYEAKNNEDLLSHLLDETIQLSKANKGFIILIENNEPIIKVARNIDKETLNDDEITLSDSIIKSVLNSGEPVVLSDALHHQKFSECTSVINLKLSSVICLPLKTSGRTLGLLYLGNESPLSYFDEGIVETMMIFAGQAALILENNRLIEALKSDNTSLREELISRRFGELIGSCSAMQEIYQKISKIAQTDVSVLITGETGTGKELIAKELHRRSNRKNCPFVTVNCAAIPENLLESELFGHMRGAFTGAYTTTVGKFQAASGGTLFLDEVGELPLNLQVKILRAIQEKQVQRVGALKTENVDIRIIAATNRDLTEEIAAGRFREDLYYRLNVVSIKLPPLRERDEDIVLLARYFLQKYAKEFNSKVRCFSPEAIRAMKKYSWPGNIRELDNVVRKAVIFAEGTIINSGDLDLGEGLDQKILPLVKARENFEMDYILSVLKKNGGNRTKTARDLGVDPRTIFRYLEKEKEGTR